MPIDGPCAGLAVAGLPCTQLTRGDQRDADASRCSDCLGGQQHFQSASVSRWLSLLIGARIEGVGGASALELKTAARSELPFELHHAAEPQEAIIVRVTAARIEHAHAVDYG